MRRLDRRPDRRLFTAHVHPAPVDPTLAKRAAVNHGNTTTATDASARKTPTERVRSTTSKATATSTTTASGSTASKSASSTSASADGVTITHPERVVFPIMRISKSDVADYYRAVAPLIVAEIARRPLSLLRCPDGAGGDCFFQKHKGRHLGAHIKAIALQQKSGTEDYLYVEDIAGLLELVQMNTLELHPWGAQVDDPEHPDRLVLRPGPWRRSRMARRGCCSARNSRQVACSRARKRSAPVRRQGPARGGADRTGSELGPGT
ncbi:ATP-dependent DNA ligase [Xanthomonas fragariae]|nr:ATP-dependent DNA ligase [Xanthomonas fragariae]